MGEPIFKLAAVFGHQAATGVPDPTIAGLVAGGGSGAGGAITPDDGLVIGQTGTGIGDTGIDFAVSRDFREKVALGFTRQPSDLIGRTIETFGVTSPARGMGRTPAGAPTNGDAALYPGYRAMFSSAGLLEQDHPVGPGRQLVPRAVNVAGPGGTLGVATSKVWIFDSTTNRTIAYVLQDVGATSFGISPDPGEIGTWPWVFTGSYASYAEEDWPEFDFGTLATTSSPSIESVGNVWGASGTARGFSELTSTISNNNQDIPDSNATRGTRTRQTGREIELEFTIYAEDGSPGDLTYEHDQLTETDIANMDSLSFYVGAAMATGVPTTGWGLEVPKLEVRGPLSPDVLGVSGAHRLTAAAVAASENGEFAINLL